MKVKRERGIMLRFSVLVCVHLRHVNLGLCCAGDNDSCLTCRAVPGFYRLRSRCILCILAHESFPVVPRLPPP